MISILQHELPASFINRHRPVVADPREPALRRYCFDWHGLCFYKSLATADAVPEAAIWSVIEADDALQLVAGEHGLAIAFIEGHLEAFS